MIAVGDGIAEWVCAGTGVEYHPGLPAIGCMVRGELVAGIVYTDFSGASVAMHSRCDNPRLVSREFYWTIFDYPFNQLGVRRVTGLVSTANLAAQRVDEHLGFVEEARLKGYFLDGDAIIYVMWKDSCKWLNLTQRYRKETT